MMTTTSRHFHFLDTGSIWEIRIFNITISTLQMQQVQSTYIFEELFCKFSNMLYHFWWIALFSFNSFDFKGHQLYFKRRKNKNVDNSTKKSCFLFQLWNVNLKLKPRKESWMLKSVWCHMRHFQFHMQCLSPDIKSCIPEPVLSHFYTSIHISHWYYYYNTEFISNSIFTLHSPQSQQSKNYGTVF